MAKTDFRRFHAARILNNWRKVLKGAYYEHALSAVTFGKVYSQDPFDCGNPKCCLCSRDKVLHSKRPRHINRREERNELMEFFKENETNPLEQ